MKPSIKAISLTLFALAVLVWVGTAAATQAHFLSYNAVDDCEIRYDDYTTYDTERVWAQNKWEARQNEHDCVDIEPDTAITASDLKWENWDGHQNMWAGYYFWSPTGRDTIYLNEWWMDHFGSGSCKAKFVAMQELGHAHGLNHSYSGNVMNPTVLNQCTLGTHDKADYEEKWGDES